MSRIFNARNKLSNENMKYLERKCLAITTRAKEWCWWSIPETLERFSDVSSLPGGRWLWLEERLGNASLFALTVQKHSEAVPVMSIRIFKIALIAWHVYGMFAQRNILLSPHNTFGNVERGRQHYRSIMPISMIGRTNGSDAFSNPKIQGSFIHIVFGASSDVFCSGTSRITSTWICIRNI